jgi:hypothetical protein
MFLFPLFIQDYIEMVDPVPEEEIKVDEEK